MINRIASFAYNGLFYGDTAHLCHSCGSGPMTAGDGFLVSRCQNCGNYHVIACQSKSVSPEGWGKRIRLATRELFQSRKNEPKQCSQQ